MPGWGGKARPRLPSGEYLVMNFGVMKLASSRSCLRAWIIRVPKLTTRRDRGGRRRGPCAGDRELRAVYQSLQRSGLRRPRAFARPGVAAGAAGAGLLFVLASQGPRFLAASQVENPRDDAALDRRLRMEWGWLFAVGFVLLIFVTNRPRGSRWRVEGIPAARPCSFVRRRFVAMHGRPRTRRRGAGRDGGPDRGSVAAWAVLAAGLALEQRLLVRSAHRGPAEPVQPRPVPRSTRPNRGRLHAYAWWSAMPSRRRAVVRIARAPPRAGVASDARASLARPLPGYDALPRRQRALIALAYARSCRPSRRFRWRVSASARGTRRRHMLAGIEFDGIALNQSAGSLGLWARSVWRSRLATQLAIWETVERSSTRARPTRPCRPRCSGGSASRPCPRHLRARDGRASSTTSAKADPRGRPRRGHASRLRAPEAPPLSAPTPRSLRLAPDLSAAAWSPSGSADEFVT